MTVSILKDILKDSNVAAFLLEFGKLFHSLTNEGLGGSDVPSEWRPGCRGFNPNRGRQLSFVEIDHEIFSTVILSLPLIQVGQFSFWRKNVHNTG